MADNVNVQGSGSIPVEAKDTGGGGAGPYRQYVSLVPNTGSAADVVGGVTETAPASDTASSGLNGRLQRIAQRLTSLITLLTGMFTGPATSVARLLSSAASTNGTNIKTSGGTLLTIIGYNAVGTVAYLKLYNKASTPTVGTDTPVITIVLPPYGPFSIALNYTFATGIGFGLTTAGADNSTSAVAAGDILGLNFLYV